MIKRLILKNKIKQCKKEIIEIEKRRYRSQASLVEAILMGKDPSDQDVDFFNKHTAKIEEIRSQIHKLQEEIDSL